MKQQQKTVKKYYAVAKGKQIGIYTDWNACKESIEGYGFAKYKSFTSFSEALNFIIDNGSEETIKNYLFMINSMMN